MKLLDSLPETEGNRERRTSLLTNQLFVYILLFNTQEYYDLLVRYEPVAAKMDNPALKGAFYARLGEIEWAFGYFDRCIETTTKSAEFCEATGTYEDAGTAYITLEWSHLMKGDFERVLKVRDDAIRMTNKRFNPRTYVYALVGASLACFYRGRWDGALEEAQKALNVAEESSDNSLISYANMIISCIHAAKGNPDEGIEYAELAVEKAPTPADKLWAQAALGAALCRAGEGAKGVDLIEPVVSITRAAPFIPTVFTSTWFLAEGYLLTGECEKASQTAEEALEVAERCGGKFFRGSANRYLGEIALRTNPDEAPPHFEQAISIFQATKAENELALAYSGMGRYHKQQGDTEQAREYLTKALEIFERLGTLIEPDKVRQELADLPSNG
jgi:tetratricopeptide (TPR) repeat protein